MSASRSVTVQFANNTNQTLTRGSFGLDSGIWSNDGSATPPEQIPPQSNATWESESDGFATGTAGFANFSLSNNLGEVVTNWDNPFAGDNSYDPSCPPGFTITTSGGGGENANVNFTLIQG